MVGVETNFTVFIKITDCPWFNNIGITVAYNTTFMDVLNVKMRIPWSYSIYVDESLGIIDIAASNFSQALRDDQTLASIKFNAVLSSNSTLEFTDTRINFFIDPISHNVADGQVEIVGPVGLTVESNEHYYYLGQNVTLYGNITVEGVKVSSLVGIEVDSPEGVPKLIRSTDSGYIPPSTSWPVEITSFYPSDDTGNPKSFFAAGFPAYFTVEVTNLSNETLPLLITVNTFDKYNSPFGYTQSQGNIGPGTMAMFLGSIQIPADIANGTAMAYANVYSQWPRKGGIPYCPEESTGFQIFDGITGSPPPPSPPPTFQADYNMTFRLPQTGGLVNWEVYTTAQYKVQTGQAQTKFIAANHFVDDDGTAGYTTIQGAINAANPLDTIYIYNGIYRENVVVNKTLTIAGESNTATIIDGKGTDTVAKATASYVSIIGFKIQNSSLTLGHNAGIEVTSYKALIKNNLVTNNTQGIWLHGSNYATVSENNITSNNDYGILLNNFNETTLSKNTITNNGYGILIDELRQSNTISKNNIATNEIGIHLYSDYTSISENNITDNNYGILLDSSSNHNSIFNNNLLNNSIGIALNYSNNNMIFENHVKNNTNYGIWLSSSENNKVYHNDFINNENQTYCVALSNSWDNNYPSSGNYWSDYTGIDEKSGPNQDQPGDDGIGDTSYEVGLLDNIDNYPLMRPYDEQDIGITDIFLSKTLVGYNTTHPMRINVRIVNYGSKTQTFNITTHYNSTMFNVTSVTLSRRDSITIVFRWNTTRVTFNRSYTISAYVTSVEDEINVTDNEYVDGSVKVAILTCDFNDDGKVGPFDFAQLSVCYGSTPDDPERWYSNADIDESDKIGPYDFAALSVNYGTHW